MSEHATNRIDRAFAAARARGERLLVTFISAGDPSPGATPALLDALAEGGADLIELGVPFSDPVADGPVIQRSSLRALDAGTTLRAVLDAVRDFRQRHDTPLLLFGYLNPLLAYGLDRAIRDAVEAGVDGFLVVDMPPEECQDFKAALDAADLRFIFLISPNTADARIARIVAPASGFIYYVALKGVTGTALADTDAAAQGVARVRAHTDLPVCVGFGISTPDDVRAVAASADGVVVGSAIVRLIEQHGHDAAPQVRRFVAALKAGTR